jgi:tetratricopeptide (TPR) repeat protein
MNVQHYGDERFMALLEPNSEQQPDSELEEHLRSCGECSELMASYRILVGAMKHEDVWQHAEPAALPDEHRVAKVASFSRQLRAEEADAAQWLEKWSIVPTYTWMDLLTHTTAMHTAGMVRKLLERGDDIYAKRPAESLLLAEAAATIADLLDEGRYPGSTVEKLRGDAWREKAYALHYTGRYADALAAVDHAERLFATVPFAEHELARVALIRALILRGFDRVTESIDLCRRSAPVFMKYGDVRRGRYARWIEAMMLHKIGRTREALEIWTELEREFAMAGESATSDLADTLHNIAMSHADLGDYERSSEYALSAVHLYQVLGIVSGQVRSRAILAQIQMARGDWSGALQTLTRVRQEFDAMSMEGEANQAALEIAEVLLVLGRTNEVVNLCRELLERFERSGLAHTWRAVTALSYLQEAAMRGTATPAKVRHVREYIRRLPSEPQLLFLEPPG